MSDERTRTSPLVLVRLDHCPSPFTDLSHYPSSSRSHSPSPHLNSSVICTPTAAYCINPC